MKPIVSIVVPVYNVQKYLNQCLDSIINQTFIEWECIIVDDGATDNSGAICDEYANRDSRIKVIHTPNQGVSAARNTALNIIQGDFVAFCDPDDWMEPTMIEHMYRTISQSDADVIQVGFWREFKGRNDIRNLVENVSVFDREEALIELARDKKIPSYMWNKMFRRSVVGPDFPAGKVFEDIYTMTRWACRINKIICDPIPLYHYRIRRGSIVNSDSSVFRLNYIAANRYRAEQISGLGLSSFNYNNACTNITKATITGAKFIARREHDKKQRNRIIELISKNLCEIGLPSPSALGPKTWFRACLLRNSPHTFAKMMRIEKKARINRKSHSQELFD